MTFLANEATRAYIYRVALAVLAVLAVYGVIADEAMPVFVGLIAALFPVGLAAGNTSTDGQR